MEIDALLDRRVLGRYRVLRKLAAGGMGVIFLGRNEGAAGFAKPVVIKRIDPSFMTVDDEAEAYFVHEARILSELRHPGIVGVLDFGREADGAYVMVLEYVHGFTLMEWLRFHRKKGARFPVDEAIYVVRRVLGALEHAHALRAADGGPRGVVHRDVTPSNVLIDVEGHIKLADFGIASSRSSDEARPKARKLRGKFPYLAPELVLGGEASIASDVYSAALVLHELLLGRNEFRTRDTRATLARIGTRVPTPVSTMRDDTPPALDGILARALAKKPSNRHPSADALAEELRLLQRAPDAEIERSLRRRVREDFEGELPALLGLEPLAVRAAALGEARASDPPPPPPRPTPTPVRVRPLVAFAVTTALLTIGGGAFALFRAPERPVEARSPSAAAEEREPPGGVAVPVAEASPILAASSPAPAPVEPEPPGGIAIPVAEGSPILAASSPDGAPIELEPGEAAPPEARPGRSPRGSVEDEPLRRAFAWHRIAVTACYEKHGGGRSRSSRVSIRFRVDADGEVRSVALSPARLAGSALGQCIVRVARSARFGPQPRPIAFTIPVTAPMPHAARPERASSMRANR